MNEHGHQLSIRLLQRCPSCRAAVQPDQIQIISETAESIFAHLSCSNCSVNYLTYIVSNQQGIMGNAILTDQDYTETRKSLSGSNITDDEVLEVVQELEKNRLLDHIKELSNHTTRKDQ